MIKQIVCSSYIWQNIRAEIINKIALQLLGSTYGGAAYILLDQNYKNLNSEKNNLHKKTLRQMLNLEIQACLEPSQKFLDDFRVLPESS